MSSALDNFYRENTRIVAAVKEVRELVLSANKQAGEHIVRLLHTGPNTHVVFMAMTNGLRAWPELHADFARMCFYGDRLDILRAVHAAGAPRWLKDMQPLPRLSDETDEARESRQRAVFGFRLPPALETPSDWLRVLCTSQTSSRAPAVYYSVVTSATQKLVERSGAFLAFAHEVDPEHPDFATLPQAALSRMHALWLAGRVEVAASAAAPRPIRRLGI